MFVLPRIGVGSGRVVRGYLGTVANGDPSWTDDRSLHDSLGLFVHYTDGVAFRATVEVRNRLVKAYQDVMNMPI